MLLGQSELARGKSDKAVDALTQVWELRNSVKFRSCVICDAVI